MKNDVRHEIHDKSSKLTMPPAELEEPHLAGYRIVAMRDRFGFQLRGPDETSEGDKVLVTDVASLKHFHIHQEEIRRLAESIAFIDEDLDEMDGSFGSVSGSMSDYIDDSCDLNMRFGELSGRREVAVERLRQLAPYLLVD